MSKTTSAKPRSGRFNFTFPTFILLTTGAILFYFASQAFTPENAHLEHWGLAALGGLIGWAIGTIVDRSNQSRHQHRA